MKKNQSINLDEQPGHLIRRMHQISVGIFMAETESLELTPIQFAALQTVNNNPGIDQKTLARVIALDSSTTGGVIDRLQSREMIERRASDHDRRVHLLYLTPLGESKLKDAMPIMLKAQERILSPLSKDERQTFMNLLNLLVNKNNEFSRAPSNTKGKS
jgi:DNA-binding MarR family transcriptional regulator